MQSVNICYSATYNNMVCCMGNNSLEITDIKDAKCKGDRVSKEPENVGRSFVSLDESTFPAAVAGIRQGSVGIHQTLSWVVGSQLNLSSLG